MKRHFLRTVDKHKKFTSIASSGGSVMRSNRHSRGRMDTQISRGHGVGHDRSVLDASYILFYIVSINKNIDGGRNEAMKSR